MKEAQYQAILQSARDSIISADIKGNIISWNRGAEITFGYQEEEVIGKPLLFLMPERYRVSHTNGFEHFRRTGEGPVIGKVVELQGIRRDGTEFPLELLISTWKEEEAIFFTAIIRDITERKQSEENRKQLAQEIGDRNRELETILYVTSHDLKEPLRAIENFAGIITQEHMEGLDLEGKNFFFRIIRASQRLGCLMDDILRLTRARKIERPTTLVNGQVILNEALARLEEEISATGAAVSLVGPFPTLAVNKTWAVEAVCNLISNAIKYKRPGVSPEIEIAPYYPKAEDLQRGIGFVVRDRGVGVPSEYAEMIFGLFKRAVGRDVEGTGVGLAIVQEVARRHGGRAWVMPREGGGSEFMITFVG